MNLILFIKYLFLIFFVINISIILIYNKIKHLKFNLSYNKKYLNNINIFIKTLLLKL